MGRGSEAFAHLPVARGMWEVAVVPDAEIRGSAAVDDLVIVEAGSGAVRARIPVPRGGSLQPALRAAIVSPQGGTAPARPRKIRCATEGELARLRADLPVRGVELTVGPVPAVDAALRSLEAARHDESQVPGLTDDVPAWRQTVGRFAELSLWTVVTREVQFRFEGGPPGLDGRVAVVSDVGDGLGAVMLFRSAEACERFLAGGLLSVDAEVLRLVAATRCAAEERATSGALGLTLSGGEVPHGYALRGAEDRSLDAAAQRRLRAAIDAICGLCARDLSRPQRQECGAIVPTPLGPVVVRSTPPAGATPQRPSLFTPSPAAFGGDPAALAEEVAEALRHGHAAAVVAALPGRRVENPPVIHTVLVAREVAAADIVNALAWADRCAVVEEAGALSVYVRSARSPWVRLTSGAPRRYAGTKAWDPGRVWIAVAVGEPEGSPSSWGDVIGARELPRVALKPPRAGEGVVRPAVVDPMFRRPPARWPKGSATLVDFVRPCVRPSALRAADMGELMTLAADVWNAVVYDDHAGEPDDLRDLVVGMLGTESWFFVAGLILRKRSHHAGDPRLFDVMGVDVVGDEFTVNVGTHLPPGVLDR